MFVLLLGTFYIFNLINSFYWNNELSEVCNVTSNKYILMVEVENNNLDKAALYIADYRAPAPGLRV